MKDQQWEAAAIAFFRIVRLSVLGTQQLSTPGGKDGLDNDAEVLILAIRDIAQLHGRRLDQFAGTGCWKPTKSAWHSAAGIVGNRSTVNGSIRRAVAFSGGKSHSIDDTYSSKTSLNTASYVVVISGKRAVVKTMGDIVSMRTS